MADEAKLIAIVEANTKQFENAMKRVERLVSGSTDKMSRSVGTLDAQFGRLGRSVQSSLAGRFAAFGVGGAAAGGLVLMAKQIATIALKYDELADAAAKAGISAVQLQRLNIATERLGGNVDDLAGFMTRFNEALGEAQAGGGNLLKLFQANNVALKDAKGNWRSTNDMLMEFSRLVHGGATKALQGEIANTVKGGRELTTVLAEGADKLRDIGDAAEAAGQVVDDKLVAAAQKFKDRWEWATKQAETSWDIAWLHMAETANTVIDAIQGSLRGAPSPWLLPPGKGGGNLPYLPFGNPAGTPGSAGGGPLKILMTNPVLRPDDAGKPTVVPTTGGGGVKPARSTGSGMTTITTKGGLKATVATAYAPQFEGLLNELEQRITIGGLSSFRPGATVAGTGRPSQHRYGRAIDVDPSMNVGTWRSGGFTDAELRAMAARWGMRWGGDFRKRDTMHFDTMGKAPLGQDAMNTAQGLATASQQTADLWKSIDEDSKSATEAWQSAQDALTNANQAFKRDLLGGFIRDLEHGVKPAEALANALTKISDRLLDMALNAIFPDVGGKVGGALLGGLFAQGGVMTGRGPLPLRRYAGGGVANSPQLAMYGEGSRPEAYVPLPDGRAIPVRIRDGSGGRQRVDVAVHPSPMFITTTQVVAEQAGHRAVASAGDNARRRAGGR